MANNNNDIIWIIGSNGQLGQVFAKNIARYTDKYFLTDIDDVDITNVQDVIRFAKDNHISTIINCSAFTDVDRAQIDCQTVRMVNVVGPRNLLCTGCRIVHFSTDYVYSGNGNTPWKEDDELYPANYYGISKMIAEKFIDDGIRYDKIPAYITLRISNLWSSELTARPNIISKLYDKIDNNQELFAYTDCYFRPTNAETLVDNVLDVILPKLTRENSGIYNYSNTGEIMNVYDIATYIAKTSNEKYDYTNMIIPSVSSDNTDTRRAIRPKYTILDLRKIEKTFGLNIPTWESTVNNYIQKRKQQ